MIRSGCDKKKHEQKSREIHECTLFRSLAMVRGRDVGHKENNFRGSPDELEQAGVIRRLRRIFCRRLIQHLSQFARERGRGEGLFAGVRRLCLTRLDERWRSRCKRK